MNRPTPHLPARLRSSAIYSLYLDGEVKAPGWMMSVDKGPLLTAIDAAATASARHKGQRRASVATVTLIVCERGISVRSRTSRMDLAGLGFWASPVVVQAARLRALVESLLGPEIDLAYSSGRLTVDEKAMNGWEL